MPQPYDDLERKLRPLAGPLPPPRPGDWLAECPAPGRTFADYVDASLPARARRTHPSWGDLQAGGVRAACDALERLLQNARPAETSVRGAAEPPCHAAPSPST